MPTLAFHTPRLRVLALILVLASLPGAALAALDPNRYAPPPGAPYTAEDVRVHTSDGQLLVGTLTLPTGVPRPLPAVFLITGSGHQDRDNAGEGSPFRPFRQIADSLSRRGIAVLRLDDRGIGGSTGMLDTMTTLERAIDTRAALAFLRGRAEVDSTRLGLLGFSEGALIAPIVALDEPALRGLVLMGSTGRSGRGIIEWQRRDQVDRDPSIPAAQKDSAYAESMKSFDTQTLHDRWTEFFEAYDARRTAMRVRVPVLILYGTADTTIPPEDARGLAAAFRAGGNLRVSVRGFEGLMHSFLDARAFSTPGEKLDQDTLALPTDLVIAISDWLQTRLRP